MSEFQRPPGSRWTCHGSQTPRSPCLPHQRSARGIACGLADDLGTPVSQASRGSVPGPCGDRRMARGRRGGGPFFLAGLSPENTPPVSPASPQSSLPALVESRDARRQAVGQVGPCGSVFSPVSREHPVLTMRPCDGTRAADNMLDLQLWCAERVMRPTTRDGMIRWRGAGR